MKVNMDTVPQLMEVLMKFSQHISWNSLNDQQNLWLIKLLVSY